MNQLRGSAAYADSALPVAGGKDTEPLRDLFHRLNNQLGIILACAELIEVKAADDTSRARAADVVAKVLDAMGTAKTIRTRTSLAA